METIYIILPVYNRREITRRFVKCLVSQTYQNYHLILIDDGSKDGTAEMVRAKIGQVTVISGSGNWWWAGALQQGYDWLSDQTLDPLGLVLIINDDTEFSDDFLAQAAALMKGWQHSLLLAPSYSRETGRLMGAGVSVNWRKLQFSQARTAEEINCLSTRGLFLTVSDFLALGGFYPQLLPHYLSDYEFTIRAHRRGMTLRVDHSIKLMVDEKMTGFHEFDGLSLRDFRRTYFARNSDANPFLWTMFIALACPWPWKLSGCMRVWYGTTKKILGSIISERTGRQT